MPATLQSIPRMAYRRLGGIVMMPFAIVTFASVGALGSLTFWSGFDPIMPDDDPYLQQLRRLEETFGANGLLMAAVDIEGEIDGAELEQIAEVTRIAGSVSGGSVISLTNVEDLFLEDDALVERRLYDPGSSTHEALRSRVAQTPLFRKLFLSSDGQAAFAYFVPDPSADAIEYAADLAVVLADTGVVLFGDAFFKHFAISTTLRELIFLGLVALAIVLIIESFIAHSVVGGLLLTSASLVPSVWTLGLMAVTRTPVTVSTLPIPVIVLVLATSYSIHVYRHVSAAEFDVASSLDHVTGVVTAAGFTTVLGFLCLTVVPSAFLREVGWFIVAGTTAAVMCALFLLPFLLGSWVARGRPRTSVRPIDRRLLAPGRASVRLLVLGVVTVTLALGLPSIRVRESFRDAFVEHHPIARAVDYYQERTGTDHELDLLIDTGQEYGLVSPETFNATRSLQERLAQPDMSIQSISYVDFVEWFIGRIDGRIGPVSPETDAEIGEALELLSGQTSILGIESLADTVWQEARLILWAGIAMHQSGSPRGLRRGAGGTGSLLRSVEIEAQRFFPDAGVTLMGMPMQNVRQTTYLVRSQVLSLLLFLACLTSFLLFLFRSLRWAIVAALPTAVGVIAYYGLLGWLGLLNDPTHVLMVCALLGVSNDDVLYFLIVYRRRRIAADHDRAVEETLHRTGVPIVQTTAIIAAGIAVFYGSAVRYLGEAAFMLTIGLLAATATTLLVVPAILKWLPDIR